MARARGTAGHKLKSRQAKKTSQGDRRRHGELGNVHGEKKVNVRMLARGIEDAERQVKGQRRQRRGLTIPKTPSLLSDARIQESLQRMQRVRQEMEEAERRQIETHHAMPLNIHALEGPTYVPTVDHNHTIAVTPAVLKGWKPKEAQEEIANAPTPYTFKARPIMVAAPVEVQKDGKHTIPKEFTFEYDKRHPETAFKADNDNNVNKDEMDNYQEELGLMDTLRERPGKKVVRVKAQRQGILSTLTNALVRRRKFKARDLPRTLDEPFQIQPQNRPITKPVGFKLQTEIRSRERQAEEQQRQERQAQRDEERARLLKEKEEREREEIRNMRRKMVIKAKPVPGYIKSKKSEGKK